MKKITSIKQLRSEKKRLRQKQEELADKIQRNWKELKEALKPANIARDTFSSIIKKKTEQNLSGDTVFKSTLNYGISLLAKKFTEKAGEKLGKLFHK